jgi:hypothetical protein
MRAASASSRCIPVTPHELAVTSGRLLVARAICERAFSFLGTDFGYRKVRGRFQRSGFDLGYRGPGLGVLVEWYPRDPLTVWLVRLEDGSLPPRDRVTDVDTPLHYFDLGDVEIIKTDSELSMRDGSTGDIRISGTDDALEYMESIVREMLLTLPITRAEAVGRLNRFWHGQEFSRELDVNLLRHEEPLYWAKTIYYGANVRWWNGEDGLEPQPYP